MVEEMSDVLLAKSTGESLAAHTAWCLKAGKVLLETLPLSDTEKQSLASEVLFGIAVHDVGKAALGFQQLLRGERKDWDGKRHEVLSAAFASRLPGVSPAVLLAILTHHRTIPDNG